MPKPISYCSVVEDGVKCAERCWAWGLCSKHYQRKKRTGRTDGLRVCKCGTLVATITSRAVCVACREINKRQSERNARLRFDYGIRQVDYDAMLAAQDGRCAICRTTDPGRGHSSFSVDHHHETGQNRGLLCHYCNIGIGHFGDDPDRLRAAADYIEAHRSLNPKGT